MRKLYCDTVRLPHIIRPEAITKAEPFNVIQVKDGILGVYRHMLLGFPLTLSDREKVEEGQSKTR